MARCIVVIVSLVLLTAQALPVGRVSAGIAGAERRAGGAASVLPGWASAEGHTPPPPDALTPAVARSLADAQPDDLVPVILVLHEQAAPDELAPALGPRSAAHVRLVLELQAVADRTQGPLRAYLEGARAAETVERVTSLWIFNGVALWARPAVVRLLASHPAVAAVHLDQQRQWIDPQVEAVGVTAAATPSTAWGVTRIGAPQVWASLGISGTGAVVAGMDTGVDWLHPALQLNYRGYNPHGAHNHVGNWFDAVGGGLYPFDNHGHGTHTMGTAVGRQGIGVAPGATWIGVKVLDGSGMGYDSWIHAGFQWLLAPGGDPAKAPDVVDCSWGNSISYLTTFQQDLRVLRASGILPVFSNGNDGPGSGTVNSPASLPEAFAVGATDQYDEVGAFSSRGPSPAPWFQIRPHVSAPGVAVRSALPGGTVGDMSGTSMAAPHVAGTVALLRSVEPTLSITSAMFLITSTAQALGSYSPNNDSGWGRLDAFEAVSVLAAPGHLSGRVVQTGRAAPIAEAQLLAVLEDSGHSVKTATDEDGFYQLSLAPGRYSVTASAFGYISDTVFGVDVTHGAITSLDFSLASLPTGTLRVRVTDADAAEITATVTVVGTPLHGVFNERDFAVPAGVYTVRGSRLGYRVVTTTTEVTVGSTTTVDLELPSAPTILLIDSGPWYYGSEAGYYRQALDDLAYVYDEQSIRLLASDIPTTSDLAPYDMVIWSAPWDAPGYIGAEDALVDYLSNGGRLLLSGQDVGYLDSGYSSYFHEYLKAQLVDDTANVWVLHGTPGDLFDGMEITITGSGGADNQVYPDEVAVTDPDVAAPVWTYEGRGCGGLRVGTCLDYRAVYLAFGFEAINDEQARQEVMRRAVEWLWTPPPTVALELTPTASLRVGAAGTVVTHTLQLRHLGERGVTDTFTLSAEGCAWDVQMEPPSITLAPCAAESLVVSVTIPAASGWNVSDTITLTARSSISPSVAQTAVLTTKTPAPVLLVDDGDRWPHYDQQSVYRAAMAEAGLAYDLWNTESEGQLGGSPTLAALSPYPIVVWWTGYDWYQPVTAAERDVLDLYLQQGGRLLLSSQDLLDFHFDSPFVSDRLGVLTCTQSITLTQVRGVPGDPISQDLGPYVLAYPFPNWSDELQPSPGTAVVLRDQERRAVALSRRESGPAAVFLSFPFEALPAAGRPAVMQQAVGWLSWLGDSTWVADRNAAAPGDVLTFTLGVRNDGPDEVSASISNTLPSELTLVDGSVAGSAGVFSASHVLAWSGALQPGALVTISYRAAVSPEVGLGSAITNPVRLRLEDQSIEFGRSAVVRVGGADLSPSTYRLEPDLVHPVGLLTGTLALVNSGIGDASAVSSTIRLPTMATLVPGSVHADAGTVTVTNGAIHWRTALGAGQGVSLSYAMHAPAAFPSVTAYSVAVVRDLVSGDGVERPAWLRVTPRRVWLPVVAKQP